MISLSFKRIFPSLDTPFMAATFECFNSFFDWEPGKLIESFQRFLDFLERGDLIQVCRVVEMGVAMARVKIFISLSKIASKLGCESKFFHQLAFKGSLMVFPLFNLSSGQKPSPIRRLITKIGRASCRERV